MATISVLRLTCQRNATVQKCTLVPELELRIFICLIFICLTPRKDCNPELWTRAGLRGHWVRHPMDMMLGWVLVVLVIGCVVVYGVRAETANDRPAEPRRRRPF